MKKLFTIIIILLFIIHIDLSAQILSFDNDSLTTMVDTSENENNIENYYTNHSGNTLVTRWEKKVIFKPSGWPVPQICDNNLCYAPHIFSKTVNLNAGAKGLLKVVAQPGKVDSCALIQVNLLVDGGITLDSAYYFYETRSCRLVLDNKYEKLEPLTAFPNPATSYIQLNNSMPIRELKVYNIQGAVIDQYFNYNKGIIPVDRFPAGNYYIISTYVNGTRAISKFMVN